MSRKFGSKLPHYPEKARHEVTAHARYQWGDGTLNWHPLPVSLGWSSEPDPLV